MRRLRSSLFASAIGCALLPGCANVQLNPYGLPYTEHNVMPPQPLLRCNLPPGAEHPFLEFGSLPLYPIEHRLNSKEGAAIMDFLVDQDGAVKPIAKSATSVNYFYTHGMTATRDWKVRPATLKGAPISTECRVHLVYKIEKRP